MTFVNIAPILPLDTQSSAIPVARLTFIGKSLTAVLFALYDDKVSMLVDALINHASSLTLLSVLAKHY